MKSLPASGSAGGGAGAAGLASAASAGSVSATGFGGSTAACWVPRSRSLAADPLDGDDAVPPRHPASSASTTKLVRISPHNADGTGRISDLGDRSLVHLVQQPSVLLLD